jgi:hypothetical protein
LLEKLIITVNLFHQFGRFNDKLCKSIRVYPAIGEIWKTKLQSIFQKLDIEVDKKIESVRGSVNVDVYATTGRIPSALVICECKYWSSPVPQSVIHSFRTVVNDVGANYGFVISKNGFQKGAYIAANNSNVILVNWLEFLDYFKEEWIKSMTLKVHLLNKDLQTYIGAGFPVFFNDEYRNLSPEQLEQFELLYWKYFNTSFYSMNHDYADLITKQFDVELFEQSIVEAQKDYDLKIDSYQCFFDLITKEAHNGVQKFDSLFGRKLRKK